MGAWGVEPFDNDDAADWAAEFDGTGESDGLEVLRRALATANAPEFLDSADGANAVAAAQVVAWSTHPGSIVDSPYAESVVEWLRTTSPAAVTPLVDDARRALDRARSSDSELAQLWAEATTEHQKWLTTLDRIGSLLNAPP